MAIKTHEEGEEQNRRHRRREKERKCLINAYGVSRLKDCIPVWAFKLYKSIGCRNVGLRFEMSDGMAAGTFII